MFFRLSLLISKLFVCICLLTMNRMLRSVQGRGVLLTSSALFMSRQTSVRNRSNSHMHASLSTDNTPGVDNPLLNQVSSSCSRVHHLTLRLVRPPFLLLIVPSNFTTRSDCPALPRSMLCTWCQPLKSSLATSMRASRNSRKH